jgi:hypothetical protein
MLQLRNSRVAKGFYKVADFVEINRLNPPRVHVYGNTTRGAENLSEPVLEMVRHGANLDDLPGLNKDKDLIEKIIYTALDRRFPARIAGGAGMQFVHSTTRINCKEDQNGFI